MNDGKIKEAMTSEGTIMPIAFLTLVVALTASPAQKLGG